MLKKVQSPHKKLSRQELKNLDLEIQFFEGLIRRDAHYVEALQVLGDDYTRRGRYTDGLRIDERLCKLCPDNSLAYYNLACSYSLTEQIELAFESLETSLQLGYHDFKWLTQDPDLENLREHPDYKRLLAKVRQMQVRAR